MVHAFFINTSAGLFKCHARLICNVTTLLGLDTFTFTYQLGYIDTPADATLDMWPEEFEYLFGTPSADGFTQNMDFVATEVLAREIAVNKLQAGLTTYIGWEHYEDHPYIPE